MHRRPFAAGLPTLYRSDKDQGWNVGMRGITQALLAGIPIPPGRIAELGCGSGQLLRALWQQFQDHSLVGIDLHPLALEYARAAVRNTPLCQGNVLHLPYAAATFGAVVAMDTLDQAGVVLPTALDEIYRILKPGGVVIARVSAYPWLWGPHDIAYNTGRRYTRRELIDAFEAAGFRAERVTFANSLLLLPIIALRLCQRWGWLKAGDRQNATSPALNFALETALQAEARWLAQRNLPFGLSLYIVATRLPSHHPAK